MIVIDSREKKFDHIREYFDKNNIPYVIEKLGEGDYQNTKHPTITIDRKANVQELCTNLSKGEENIIRFTKECKRAREKQLAFIVLIEGTNCKTVSDLHNWKSKYSRHTGKWLVDRMFNLTVTYQVQWMFCKKNETAKKILELLHYDS